MCKSVFFFFVFVFLKLSAQEKQLLIEGQKVPNGTVMDINGNDIEIKKFQGNYLIIDFWASWCAPCIKEAPIFKRIGERYNQENVRFISISVDSDFDDWIEFTSRKGWEVGQYWFGMKESDPFFSLVYDKHTIGGTDQILVSLPKYVFISPEGEIIENSGLRPSNPEFESKLEKLLN